MVDFKPLVSMNEEVVQWCPLFEVQMRNISTMLLEQP